MVEEQWMDQCARPPQWKWTITLARAVTAVAGTAAWCSRTLTTTIDYAHRTNWFHHHRNHLPWCSMEHSMGDHVPFHWCKIVRPSKRDSCGSSSRIDSSSTAGRNASSYWPQTTWRASRRAPKRLACPKWAVSCTRWVNERFGDEGRQVRTAKLMMWPGNCGVIWTIVVKWSRAHTLLSSEVVGADGLLSGQTIVLLLLHHHNPPCLLAKQTELWLSKLAFICLVTRLTVIHSVPSLQTNLVLVTLIQINLNEIQTLTWVDKKKNGVIGVQVGGNRAGVGSITDHDPVLIPFPPSNKQLSNTAIFLWNNMEFLLDEWMLALQESTHRTKNRRETLRKSATLMPNMIQLTSHSGSMMRMTNGHGDGHNDTFLHSPHSASKDFNLGERSVMVVADAKCIPFVWP